MSHNTECNDVSPEQQLLELIDLPCGQDNDVRELVALLSAKDQHGISHIGHDFVFEIEDTTFSDNANTYNVKDYFSMYASGLYLVKSTQGILANSIDVNVVVKDFAGRYKPAKETITLSRDSNCYCRGSTTFDRNKEDYWANNPCTSTTLPPAITLSKPQKVTSTFTKSEIANCSDCSN